MGLAHPELVHQPQRVGREVLGRHRLVHLRAAPAPRLSKAMTRKCGRSSSICERHAVCRPRGRESAPRPARCRRRGSADCSGPPMLRAVRLAWDPSGIGEGGLTRRRDAPAARAAARRRLRACPRRPRGRCPAARRRRPAPAPAPGSASTSTIEHLLLQALQHLLPPRARSAAPALRKARPAASRRGLVISARPMASICSSPPDRLDAIWCCRSFRRGKIRLTSRASTGGPGRDGRAARGDVEVFPAPSGCRRCAAPAAPGRRRRAKSPRAPRSGSARRPASTCRARGRKPTRVWMVVDLPAPLRPSSASSRPSAAARTRRAAPWLSP